MLAGVQDEDDLELDKKQAELERRLKALLRENSAISQEAAKMQRSHDRLEDQASKLKVAVVWSAISASSNEKPPMTRYEQMRQRKDRKEAKVKSHVVTQTSTQSSDQSPKVVIKK
jgi:hypothetical protein